jgi:hypothetical protein
MRTYNLLLITFLLFASQVMVGQRYDEFLDAYHFNKDFENPKVKNSNAYDDVQGSPYLNREFTEGLIYLKDTTAVRLPLRYNIYTDEMEYLLNEVVYEVGNPRFINKVLLEGSVFVYLQFVDKGGFFELLEAGKCSLVQKRKVAYQPAEGPKPIQGTITPAKFLKDPDVFYILTTDSQVFRITNMKSVVNALKDHQPEIEAYTREEGIRGTRKDNLLKIAKFYNTL